MTSTSTTASGAVGTETTKVYRVYIKAPAQKIWDALTTAEWSQRYGYGGFVSYDLRPGGALSVAPDDAMRKGAAEMGYEMPDVIIDGEVLEADPPHRLVTTWRMLMDPETAAEGFTTLTYEIKALDEGYCALTVIHDLTGAPKLAAVVTGAMGDTEEGAGAGGGHPWILSDLKSLLETGSRLSG